MVDTAEHSQCVAVEELSVINGLLGLSSLRELAYVWVRRPLRMFGSLQGVCASRGGSVLEISRLAERSLESEAALAL